MKHLFLILFLICAATGSGFAQKSKSSAITDEQWEKLLKAVSSEDWETSVKLSSNYLEQIKDDDEKKNLAKIRYIYLFSAAGKVSEGKMSFEEFESSVKDLVGKEVMLPFREVVQNCQGSLNFICPSEGGKNKLFTAATNQAGTTIHAFEYVGLKENFDVSKHVGEEFSIGGIIKSIAPNPNKSRILVMRLYITDGYILNRKDLRPKTTADDLSPGPEINLAAINSLPPYFDERRRLSFNATKNEKLCPK